MIRRCRATALVALFLVGATREATAQSFSGPPEAEALFEEGRRLLLQGRAEEACPKFEASLRLDVGVGTLLFLAGCRETLGQTATAWTTFREACALATKQGDPRAAVARSRAARLEERLSRLRLDFDSPAPADLRILRDDVTIPSAAFELALPVDPGIHVVRVSRPGFQPWSVRVVVDPGPTDAHVKIPVLAPVPHSVERSCRWSWGQYVGTGLAGVGVLALGTAVGLFAGAESTYAAAQQRGDCSTRGTCTAEGLRSYDRAAGLEAAATSTAVAGGVSMALGIGAFLFVPRSCVESPGSISRQGIAF